MTLDIPDDISGKERKRLVERLMWEYAEKMFKTRAEICDFLGCSVRTLTTLRNRYNPPEDLVTPAMIELIKSTPAYRYADDKQRFLSQYKSLINRRKGPLARALLDL